MLKRLAGAALDENPSATPAPAARSAEESADDGDVRHHRRRLSCELALAERFYHLKHGGSADRATRWGLTLLVSVVLGAAIADQVLRADPSAGSATTAVVGGVVSGVGCAALLAGLHLGFSDAGRARRGVRRMRRALDALDRRQVS